MTSTAIMNQYQLDTVINVRYKGTYLSRARAREVTPSPFIPKVCAQGRPPFQGRPPSTNSRRDRLSAVRHPLVDVGYRFRYRKRVAGSCRLGFVGRRGGDELALFAAKILYAYAHALKSDSTSREYGSDGRVQDMSKELSDLQQELTPQFGEE
ncbi:hypothetical protein RB195_009011 [Necator americanus]|uniref:Uncharacterized protein n=1 Tax=Necator americanus TaxID=51031 RepID=A0ABR1CRC4_NECAM